MIHHVSVGTDDLNRSIRFYDAVLPGLGLRRILDDTGEGMHYGTGHIEFSTIRTDAPATAGNGVHIAFDVERRAMVDAFHRDALANGGSDAGAPGLRPHYDANYYAAFVRDPDGNKIEALTYSAA
ncbi:VOC family protein [Sphingomonas sp. 1P08PE]|uniref:VOC family protein n=1 Tax=Sphingomonas sp. 1P08PE TaxID=554122 RepID=UPI0039A300EE